RAAIICVNGIYSHWTVIQAVTPKTIRLLDSLGPRYLRRSACAIAPDQRRFSIDPRSIVLIERKRLSSKKKHRIVSRPDETEERFRRQKRRLGDRLESLTAA